MAVNLFLDTDVTLSDALESQTQTQIDGSRVVRNLGNISDPHSFQWNLLCCRICPEVEMLTFMTLHNVRLYVSVGRHNPLKYTRQHCQNLKPSGNYICQVLLR
jgi:hypothetical protein